ncbi:Macrolide export protein MacA [Stieleria maiorica]|uniref:Macrolide export protein MacA n=1 Tax=Stieleria maiorica TaxID=2795974 RepID=A0A5B9MCR2_9BACT|nr:efflux RND transporter periplasmic adaptor subunit [Stieleria maiorica]QEF97027.1 Macrolide export protein MacA [Stieleria maiorica]
MKSCHRSADVRLLSFQTVLIAGIALVCRSSLATEVQGYTEPVRTIEVASDETGTVDEVLVHLGQKIEQGQPLLRLNSQVHLAQIEVAKQQMNAQGRLDAAKAEVELTSARLEKLESLRKSGHARQAELHRAAKEFKVAEANLRSVVEEMETRRLEHDRLLTQMRRRVIHAPVTGIVTELHKEPGEFVAPNKPEIITLVQLDTLLANFALLGSQAEQLTTGQEIELQFSESGQVTSGKVHFISPVTDAESGTVLVKIAIDNADGMIRSGARCAIQLKD